MNNFCYAGNGTFLDTSVLQEDPVIFVFPEAPIAKISGLDFGRLFFFRG
jgi:hypothetical protein